MTQQFVVSSVEPIKSGPGKFGQWTLYRITTEDGKKITTFDSEWMNKVGQAVVAEVEEVLSDKKDKQGNPYKNLRIVDPKKKEYQPKTAPEKLLALELLKEMNGKLDLLLSRVPGKTPSNEMPDDLPF